MEESTKSVHRSVLEQEVIDGLDLHHADVVLDATVNGGGHASRIIEHLGPNGSFIGIDLDANALARSAKRLALANCPVELIQANFSDLDRVLDELELMSVDKVLFDLGWSSDQFEDPERGFSFRLEGPLTMTLSTESDSTAFTAYDIINTWEEEHIVDILKGYGEESYAKKIAASIVREREVKPILTTTELASIIESSVPRWYQAGNIHPATKTFQALRIAVNNELEVLRQGLSKAFERLAPKGRILVISFHSIEDRIVKHAFKDYVQGGRAHLVVKKPITATDEELALNRRARSAKLRIIEKIS